MSGYVRQVIFTGAVDGEPVTLTMSPLLVEDLLRIRSATGDQTAFIEAVIPILRAHVKEMTPVKAADGSDVGLEELLSSAYFAKLIVDAGLELVKCATPANP